MKYIKQYVPHIIALAVSGIFLDSLRFKFTNHPNTQVIFGKLDAWAASLGVPGLFSTTGLFSQYIIGSAELVAVILLVVGIHPKFRRLQGFGALLALAIMTAAISFHLFTPLGIDPNNDGGGLFVAAVAVWTGALVMAVTRRASIIETINKILKK